MVKIPQESKRNIVEGVSMLKEWLVQLLRSDMNNEDVSKPLKDMLIEAKMLVRNLEDAQQSLKEGDNNVR